MLDILLASVQPFVNKSPPKLLFEAMAMNPPEPIKPTLGAFINSIAIAAPTNLLFPAGSPRRAVFPGDRVKSSKHMLTYADKFGGFVLFIAGDKALVMWDGGVLTVDDLKDLEKVV